MAEIRYMGNLFDACIVMGRAVCSTQSCRFSVCNAEPLEENWSSGSGSRV
jgi:hypothetical protein